VPLVKLPRCYAVSTVCKPTQTPSLSVKLSLLLNRAVASLARGGTRLGAWPTGRHDGTGLVPSHLQRPRRPTGRPSARRMSRIGREAHEPLEASSFISRRLMFWLYIALVARGRRAVSSTCHAEAAACMRRWKPCARQFGGEAQQDTVSFVTLC
jgi:hypothetical protein